MKYTYKKNKFLIIPLLVAIILSIFSGCSGKDYTNIKIISNGSEFSYVAVNYKDDTGNEFPNAIAQSEVPYVELGSEFTIEFPKRPDSYQVSDRVIYGDGVLKYADKDRISLSCVRDGNNIVFSLPMNYTSFFDSTIDEQEYVYRGVQINCIYGDDEYRYYFVIKTAASRV